MNTVFVIYSDILVKIIEEMAPALRNLLQRKVTSTIAVGLGIGLVSALTWKFAYADPKQAKYAAFYKNYDADAEAKALEARIAAASK